MGNLPCSEVRKRRVEDEEMKPTTKSNNSLVDIDSVLVKVARSICKIEVDTQKGTGFLLQFHIDETKEDFYCLLTNEHVIEKDYIEKKGSINIQYDTEHKNISIKLDDKERYIKSFKDFSKDIGLDITIVEIIDKDGVGGDFFLSPMLNINRKKLENSKIYIPQYPKGEDLKYSKGEITKIDKYEIAYSIDTKSGSSGSPIFLKNQIQVIGIHKMRFKDDKKEKLGDFIYPAIEVVKKDIISKRKSIVKKFTKEGGRYEGQLNLNGLRHGKGKEYYKNGNIKYDGDFVNDKFEGNGKYIWENGEYYIGQWKNGSRYGKGKLFYKNGDIMYDGEYIEDKREGKGKFIDDDGEYYEGEWKKGLRHGKGKLYYKNGNIKYEGDFFDDKIEGIGRCNYENGDYYIGQWRNNLKHGKGEYYRDGMIKFAGYFFNNKFEGN